MNSRRMGSFASSILAKALRTWRCRSRTSAPVNSEPSEAARDSSSASSFRSRFNSRNFSGYAFFSKVARRNPGGVPKTSELPHLTWVSIVTNGSSCIAELIQRLNFVSMTAVRVLVHAENPVLRNIALPLLVGAAVVQFFAAGGDVVDVLDQEMAAAAGRIEADQLPRLPAGQAGQGLVDARARQGTW